MTQINNITLVSNWHTHSGNTLASCTQCGLRALCLPIGLTEQEFIQINSMVSQHRKVARGRTLYHNGAPFEALFAIKTGFFKTSVIAVDGREHVTGFQMPGELLGMDGISGEQHSCNAKALEDAEVCVIPFSILERLTREVKTFQRHFHQVMSREIVRDQSVMMLLGTLRAEERLAIFLLNLSQRFGLCGYSSKEFYLRMTREDIGSYLGMKLETVSRMFSKFQEVGLVRVQQRHIRILHTDGLYALLEHRSKEKLSVGISPIESGVASKAHL